MNLNICQVGDGDDNGNEGDVLSRFSGKFFAKTLKLNIGRDFEAKFDQDEV